MSTEKYFTLAKIALLIPLVSGLITITELFLPLQKKETVVESKHTSENKLGNTTYSINFLDGNDQFTEEIYNMINEGDSVQLEVMYFTKEVKTLQLKGGTVMSNNTSEIYFQLGFALVFIGFSIFFLRKKYYTNKNYRYIVVVCLIGLVSLIRVINLNL